MLLARIEAIARLGSWRLNLADGRYTASDELLEILGIDPDTVGEAGVPQGLAAIIHPDDRGRVMAAASAAVAGGSVPEGDFRTVRPDGTIRWLHAVGELEHDPEGQVIGMVGYVQDVTERVAGQAEQLEHEARYRRALDGMLEGVAIIGRDWTYRYLNETAARYLGLPRSEIEGHTVSQLNPRFRDRELVGRLNRAMRTREPDHFEFPVALPDGTSRWFEFSFEPTDEGLLVLSLDVTDRRAADDAIRASEARLRGSEAALRESEERFRVMAEHSMSGVYIIDGGTFSYVNPTLARMFGYTTDELIGADPNIVIHPDFRLLVQENIRRRVDREVEAIQYEFKGLRLDGTVVPVLVFGAAAELGGRTVVVGNIVDLTERYELEERLRQAEKLEAVGQLAGGIAHDFNNLLTAIEGYAGLVDQSLAEDDVARGDLERIRQASSRAAALTRQLLAFSRRQTLAPEVIDPADVIDEILPLLSRLLGEHIVLSTRHTLDHGHVLADRTQLEQVIVNLAVNARDAMPSGGRLSIETVGIRLTAVHVAGETEMPAGSYVRITVTDTGRGIDQAARERIFEPYFTTKEVGRGTGMGLATVYGIVRQSGGRITFESAVGHGTTFRIDLPSIKAPAVAHIPAIPMAAPSHPTGSETILLVEDEDVIRAFLRRVLAGHGYTVIEASTGAAALTSVEGDAPFHMVVTDMAMPGMQGDELVRRLHETRPGLPALVISGFAGDSLEGVEGYRLLHKPFDAEAFLQTVREALDVAANEPGQPSEPEPAELPRIRRASSS